MCIGDAAVGKTSLIRRLEVDEFCQQSEPTLGARTSRLTYRVEGELLSIELFDTAGYERFHSLIRVYLRQTNIACVCYAVDTL